ncbi:hypothetical protein AGMMS4957_14610 [Bacteroidia bacterium]|nr:hypothetical protein AGMMS4957_14610 [Bacteroidia bacterium]
MCEKKNIKRNFKERFNLLLKKEKVFNDLMRELKNSDSQAYVVGGFFRDVICDKKESRDIDIIVDIIDGNTRLLEIVQSLNCDFTTNRHGGIKISLNKITVDLWSIENNWAFKENLVKLNENYKLNSIAKGCFFNYDSLVINLHDFSYSLKYYNDFQKSKTLDIIKKSPSYKNLNPTTEANIIRAIYIKHVCNSDYSEDTMDYIVKKLGELRDKYDNYIQRILEVKSNYPKYGQLSDTDIEKELASLVKKTASKK